MSTKNATTKPTFVPVLVLYGLGEDGKPRAAKFDEVQAQSAQRLGEKLGLNMLRVVTEQEAAVANELEGGKLFLSGRGSVPAVAQGLYDRLLALPAKPAEEASAGSTSVPAQAGATPVGGATVEASVASGEVGKAEPTQKPEASPQNATGAAKTSNTPPLRGLPASWEGIEVGHLVLAQASVEDGWWEAVILEREDDLFTMLWRDAPKYPKFIRHRSSLALICPPAA